MERFDNYRTSLLIAMPESDVQGFIVALLFPMIVSGLSGFFTVKNVLWFMSLLQSKFTPPRKTFRVMWTMSYVLMGISSFLVWRQERDLQSPTLIVYALQLAINALYCPLFFGLKRLDIALADIILLDTVLVYCIFLFSQISVLAAALMLPYLAWTIFSTALNADFYRLSVGKEKDPVFFTTNYSCHHLYQSTLDSQKAKDKNMFYSSIPDAPEVSKTTPPLISEPSKFQSVGPTKAPLRFRFGQTPESLYVQ